MSPGAQVWISLCISWASKMWRLGSFSKKKKNQLLITSLPLYHLLKLIPFISFLSQFPPLCLCAAFSVLLASDSLSSNFSLLLYLISYLTLPLIFLFFVFHFYNIYLVHFQNCLVSSRHLLQLMFSISSFKSFNNIKILFS